MELWQKKEKHDKEVKEVLKQLGCMDTMGRIRRWDGKKVWAELEKLGHTSLDCDKCKCLRG